MKHPAQPPELSNAKAEHVMLMRANSELVAAGSALLRSLLSLPVSERDRRLGDPARIPIAPGVEGQIDTLASAVLDWLNLPLELDLARQEAQKRAWCGPDALLARLAELARHRDNLTVELQQGRASIQMMEAQGEPLASMAGMFRAMLQKGQGQLSEIEDEISEVDRQLTRLEGLGSVATSAETEPLHS
jgi:hypothetical protein